MESIDSRRGVHFPAMPASLAHVVPFAVWLICMTVFKGADLYWVRTVATVLALLICRPWRWYRGPEFRHLPATVLVGAGMALIWILPESAWMQLHAPALHAFYLRVAVIGTPTADPAFLPENINWLSVLIRLCGSAFVIAMAEEVFWRGFAYRRLQQVQFLEAHPEDFSIFAFAMVAIAFGFEHARWFVGILAGVGYGLLYVKTRNLWSAILAHIITNWLLGLYVLRAQAYQFW